jgi:hypothetical protein
LLTEQYTTNEISRLDKRIKSCNSLIESFTIFQTMNDDVEPWSLWKPHLAEHDEGLLYPGEDPQGDVGRATFAEGVAVRYVKAQG